MQAGCLEVLGRRAGGIIFLQEKVGNHRMNIGVVGKKFGDTAVLVQGSIPGTRLSVIVGALQELAFIIGRGHAGTESECQNLDSFIILHSMFNAWDFVLAALLLLLAWIGWKLKSLPLLGAGFAFELSPMAAATWNGALGRFLLEHLGGKGLSPHQNELAWWLILLGTGAALMMLFLSFSKFLAQLKLEFLDQSFGACMIAAIYLCLLSFHFNSFANLLNGSGRHALAQSWSWNHLRVSAEPLWLENLQEKIESLKLPQKP
jgi:hypothetical protein